MAFTTHHLDRPAGTRIPTPRRRTRILPVLTAVAALALLMLAPAAAQASLRTHGPLHLDNAHDRVFTGLHFEGRGSGWGDDSGLIHITGRSHDIVFKDCVIDTNQDGVGNGVKIIDFGRGMHDITFRHCTFKYQPRMGFECIGRESGSRTGYQRVNLIDCTFEASAGEAISYDDDNGTAGHCRIEGNLVKGAGVGDSYQYGQVFEINGVHDMTVVGNRFYSGRDGILNLQMRDSRSCGWLFTRNVIDARKVADGITVQSTAQPVVASGVHGGRFPRNKVINLDAWNIAYLVDCHDMDWRTTAWQGPNHLPYNTGCTGLHL
jgi:hypothetical protein